MTKHCDAVARRCSDWHRPSAPDCQACVRAEPQDNRRDELRILVRRGRSQVKVEVSPVLRGTLHPPQERDVVEAVEDEYGFAAV